MLSKAAEKDRARAEAKRLADEKRRRFLRVTPDCGEVEWAGVPFAFDESQRKVVARLWALREDDEPFAHERTLLALSGSKRFALRDVFHGHPAWGTVVVPVPASAKLEGSYMLGAIPEDW